jgi:hypothetical protein
MGINTYLRRASAAIAIAVIIVSGSAGAVAASGQATTTTEIVHGAIDFGPQPIFCSENPGVATGDVNAVFHTTDLGDGRFSSTYRISGTAQFTPDDSANPTVSGRFVVGDTTISGVVGVTDTFVYINHGWASDGTSFRFHEVAHISFNTNGVAVEWDKASLTCE